LPKSGIKSAKWIGVAACLVLTFNNCINYARNRETIGQPNIHSNPWFAFKDTPDESLRFWLEYTEKGGALVCKGGYCPYAEIYAAIAGFRKWNGLSELPVQAYDPKTDQIVILNPDLWKRYYFRH
jgi:hypothetical protein